MDEEYASMSNQFTGGEGSRFHSTVVPGEHGTSYTYYIRAIDSLGNVMDTSGTISFTVDTAQCVALIDFGANAGSNTYGLPDWQTAIKDVYTDYRNLGPGGTTITGGSTPEYNFQGVSGLSPYAFNTDQKIAVSWYNNSGSTIIVTPKISFNDPDRPVSGISGAWYAMTLVRIPSHGSAYSEYYFNDSSAGAYNLVNVNCNYRNNQVLVCDKIVLLNCDTALTGRENILDNTADGDILLTVSPNPFNPATMIRVAVSAARENSAEHDIQVRIYDIHGTRVAVLHPMMSDNNRPSSSVQYMFDASHFASGIYLVKAHFRNRAASKRVILLK